MPNKASPDQTFPDFDAPIPNSWEGGEPGPHETVRRIGRLRFAAPLENIFVSQIREAQRSFLFIWTVVALGIWLSFAGIDVIRYLPIQDTPQASLYEFGIFFPRGLLTLILVAFLLALHKRWLGSQEVYVAMLVLLLMGLAAFVTVNVSRICHLPQGESAYLLLVAAAFFPIGATFYEGLTLAILLCVSAFASGPIMLDDPEMLASHWRVCAMTVLALVLSAVSGYMREYALREHFLLRRFLSWQANHDPLTGLGNRRTFEEHLSRTLAYAQRHRDFLCLAVLDVDSFKQYNDHYGHPQGDRILQQVAKLINSYARRPLDLSARIGGEEFSLLLYGANIESALNRLEKLRSELSNLNIPHVGSLETGNITLSIGLALASSIDTPATLVKRADDLLYAAKNAGRNRIVSQTLV